MKNFNDLNAVIFGLVVDFKDQIVPMGSLYDSLEYFMKISEFNKDIVLIFHLVSQDGSKLFTPEEKIKIQLMKILQGKYNKDALVDFPLDAVVVVDLKKLFWNNHLSKILTIDMASPGKFKEFMARSKEVFIIPEWTTERYFYQSKVNKVQYYTEMPFCHCDVPYRLKMDFEKLKALDAFPNKLYVNYPKRDPSQYPEIQAKINTFNKEVLVKEDQFFYDIHEHFNEYIYFQSDDWFDPHPKLFHECKFYGKPYHYSNSSGVKDGAFYRYQWSLTDNLKDLQLNQDDILIKEMSS